MFERRPPLRHLGPFLGTPPRPRHTGPGRSAVADPVPAPAPHRSVVDSAVYRDGRRVALPPSLEGTYAALDAVDDHDLVWIDLQEPDPADLASLAARYGLHELSLEDAIQAHQRPKLERYGHTLFVVLRAAHYDDAAERVDFGELHVFVGPDFVLTVQQTPSPEVAQVRQRLDADPQILRHGTEALLYALLDAVVDGYTPVIAGLEHDIDEIEAEVFREDREASRRIYELSREVVDFQRAVTSLPGILAALTAGFTKYRVGDELQRYLRDVADHVTSVTESIEASRASLRDILTVNATLVAQRQNDEMRSLTQASYEQGEEVKKISAWAAILFAPTLVGTVYGMNFRVMPELQWAAGYPFALGLMAVVCAGLYVVFRRRDWL